MYDKNNAEVSPGNDATDFFFGAMQKVCHSPEGEGGLKNCHSAMTNEPFVTLLGGGGMKYPFFRVTYILHGPLPAVSSSSFWLIIG